MAGPAHELLKRVIVILALSLALGFGGLYLAAGGALFRVDTYRVQDPSFPIFLVFLTALIGQWSVPAFKIQLLCMSQGISMPYRPALYTHLVAVFGAAITPNNTGGVPTTVAALGRLGVPLGKGIGVIVQIFVLDLIFFSWTTPLGIGYLIYSRTIHLPVSANILAFAAVVLAIAAAVILTRYPRVIVRLILTMAKWPLFRRFDSGMLKAARDYYRSANAYLNMPASTWLVLHLVTAIGWISGFVILWVLLHLYGIGASLLTTLALLSSITLISNFIPTPGGSGFIEAAVSLSVGAGAGSIAAAVLVWRLTSFYLIFLLGPPAGWLLYLSPPVVFPKGSETTPKREPEKRL